jgi:hypothetical protein
MLKEGGATITLLPLLLLTVVEEEGMPAVMGAEKGKVKGGEMKGVEEDMDSGLEELVVGFTRSKKLVDGVRMVLE